MSALPGFWKLLPANPILLRVVTAGGRRLRHALTRWIYLALLIAVLLVALVVGGVGRQSLSELAKASSQVLAAISYVQLAMICLLAPVFTAGAITQERDSRTYNILLSTPLTNAQIVLGSLMSRLYYVIVLLLAGVPVFAITLYYGGVTVWSIFMSFAIALSTAIFTGALAITIAVFRLGTGKTVFWFYVFNAVYLVGLWIIDANLSAGQTTWLTGIHPFLALQSVVTPTGYAAPDLAALGEMWGPVRWYRAYPAAAYVTITLTSSLLMVGPSALVLRRIAQRSDVGLWQYLRSVIFPKWESRARKPRNVWGNPVAWREAATRAGASARGITRWLTVVVGIIASIALLYFYHQAWAANGSAPAPASPQQVQTFTEYGAPAAPLTAYWRADIRKWLLGLVVLEFAVALLVATNTSASAVTRERESQTLDLLLVTPITSRYYIWGKLRGLVSFMAPFAITPAITVFLVVLYDLFRGNLFDDPLVFPEVVIQLPLFLMVIIAWACMLGLQLSLKWSRTIVAVMASVGVLLAIAGVLGVCGLAALQVPVLGLIFSAFSPMQGVAVLLDPLNWASESFEGSTSNVPVGVGRLIIAASFAVSISVYCLLVWAMYKGMVKNFDMIIRRQHQ